MLNSCRTMPSFPLKNCKLSSRTLLSCSTISGCITTTFLMKSTMAIQLWWKGSTLEREAALTFTLTTIFLHGLIIPSEVSLESSSPSPSPSLSPLPPATSTQSTVSASQLLKTPDDLLDPALPVSSSLPENMETQPAHYKWWWARWPCHLSVLSLLLCRDQHAWWQILLPGLSCSTRVNQTVSDQDWFYSDQEVVWTQDLKMTKTLNTDQA